MKKLLLALMLMSAPAFACQDVKYPEVATSGGEYNAKKARKEAKRANDKRCKEIKKGYRQWRRCEKARDGMGAVATVYWSPDRAAEYNIKVPRDSSGNRVDTSYNV